MARKRSVRTVPGYGEGLRSKLAQLGLSQVQLANAAGISRQTISRALAADEVSALSEARIDQALSRTAAPTSRSINPAPTAWAKATDLVTWSDRRDAQHEFPLLVASLIRQTVSELERVSFRSGEGVQLGGWDGRVTSRITTPFVPAGESGWELSTSVKVGDKAETNYQKRTQDPGDLTPRDSTFVFVTLRRWPQKDSWRTARKADGLWRDVRVMDADDLELWLHDAPALHLRLSRQIVAFPTGAQDLEYWWQNWSGATRPPLTAEFMLAGRQEDAKKITEALQARGSVLGIKSESKQESIAVLASAMKVSPGDDDSFSRTIVVEDGAAWRTLVASTNPLVLVPTFDVGDAVAAAQRAGHVTVLPLGENEQGPSNTIELPQVGRSEAVAALIATGELPEREKHEQEKKAHELAKLARRSMTALRRQIAAGSQLQRPIWARPENARKVLPAVFAGAWNGAIAGDRAFVSSMAAKPYESVAEDLEPFVFGTDPAVRRRGSLWYLVSREDAWELLAKYVTDDDVGRFRDAAIQVLIGKQPVFDVPRDKRWLAGMLGDKPSNSGLLRTAVAETIGLIGSRADAAAKREIGATFGGAGSLSVAANRILREVFEVANRDWRVWAAISDVLGDLGEGAPDVLLSALETGLAETPSPVMALFDEETDGMFGGPSPHTGLLWALERLSWGSDHLGRVVKVLAELARRDPGGRLSNRPQASLATIFRPWLPQTGAPLERRFAVLDALARSHEDVVWKILVSMLPETHGVGFYSARPRWREWDSRPEPVKNSEYMAAVRGTVERMLRLAKLNGERWAALVNALPNVGKSEFDSILEGLAALPDVDEGASANIASALREVVASHRNFPDATWALTAPLVDRIDQLRARFEPTDLVERHKWLFTWHARLPKPERKDLEDYAADEEEVLGERVKAVAEVYSKLGTEGLLRLAAAAEEPQMVGHASAKAKLYELADSSMIVHYAASDTTYESALARGYAVGMWQREGTKWIEATLATLAGVLRPKQKASLLQLLETEPRTWELAASFGAETEREYWSTVHFVRDHVHVEEAVRRLAQFGRLHTAADVLAMYTRKSRIDGGLIANVLHRILKGEANDPVRSDFRYDLTSLIEALYNASGVDRQELAQIEWGFLPVLEFGHHPKALHQLLAEQPEFFVELVEHVFRGEDDPPKAENEITEEDKERASRSYSLLHSWRTLPGIREDRTVDGEILSNWITRARELLSESHRQAIGDQLIGQMLSGAPSDADGTWPSAPVRLVIESAASEELERGLAIGKYNSRGVVSRSIGAGGRDERAIAERYEGLAASVADDSPRTAHMLRLMADDYRRDADREDRSAALEDDLDR